MSDDLVQSADQQICEKWHFTNSELSREFPQISSPVLYKIFRVRLRYHKFCTTLILKMPMCAHKMQRMASALNIFTAIPQRWQ
jgi:hypothetical protein